MVIYFIFCILYDYTKDFARERNKKERNSNKLKYGCILYARIKGFAKEANQKKLDHLTYATV
jgi:hypothetical protein